MEEIVNDFHLLLGNPVHTGDRVELGRVLVHADGKGRELAQVQRIGDGVDVLEDDGLPMEEY